ncbi:hypothetical protein [Streptomyces roseochromogenus]|uniref:Uncharacterized protein n=1 Tax=Streptomyces roseochromogenus subsp. oscitans DS 12.976 TaxID=1352936 RepID=V6KA07_STRRC|nr:hypothetical protein [Streptomyces roseochromogenus]EST28977.1 hypothetical protein M878_21560 [Streptomyces roseochromogenus subsp. oscitans DS 12.976]
MTTQPNADRTPEAESLTGLRRPVPVVLDIDDDPMEGIPAELVDMVGQFDRDTAGGCG